MEVCFKKFASLFIYPSSIHCFSPINCPAPISSSLQPLHCPAPPLLSCIHLHCLAWLYTVMHPLTLSCTLYTVLYSLTLSCTFYTVLYSFILSWIPLHCPARHYTVLHSITLLHSIVASTQPSFQFPCHIRYCVPLSSLVLLFNPLLPSVLLLYAPLTFILKYTQPCIHCKHMRMNCVFCLSAFDLNLLRSWFQRALISWDFHTLIFS